jgi:ribonuclease HI
MIQEKCTIYTDAGSRGNPGNSAAACLLLAQDGSIVDLDAKYLGVMTNNMAEYEGLLLGLRLAVSHGCKQLVVTMDSELVIKQMKGEYKIKDEKIKLLYNQVVGLREQFDEVSFSHVFREQNKIADKLVNIILDTK